MDYALYILFSKKLDKFYIGQTENLEIRLKQHNDGYSKFTSKVKDWELVYSELFETRLEAINREKAIKLKKSRKYIEWLIIQKPFCFFNLIERYLQS